jgi:hypothetical protein
MTATGKYWLPVSRITISLTSGDIGEREDVARKLQKYLMTRNYPEINSSNKLNHTGV